MAKTISQIAKRRISFNKLIKSAQKLRKELNEDIAIRELVAIDKENNKDDWTYSNQGEVFLNRTEMLRELSNAIDEQLSGIE